MYADNPTAFHLRAMNMLYEGFKRSNATIVIVPSTAVESMQLGGMPTMATVASAIAHAQSAGGGAAGHFKRVRASERGAMVGLIKASTNMPTEEVHSADGEFAR